jgi:O-antigen ligase
MFSLIGLIVYLTLELLRPEVIIPNAGEQIMFWVAIGTAAIWVVEFVISGFAWKSYPSTRFLIAFTLVAAFSSVLSGDPGAVVADKFQTLMKLVFVYVIVVQSVTTTRRLNLLRWFIVTLILILCFGGLAFSRGYAFPGFKLDSEDRLQYTGIFADSNDLGQIYNVGWALLLFDLANAGGKVRRIFVVGFLWALGTGIFLTQSRGAILGAAAALVLSFRKRVGLVVPGILALSLLIAMNRLGVARMDQLSTGEQSAEARLMAWAGGWYMLRSNPLFGVGPDNFRGNHGRAAHSTLVQIGSETGLLGLFCWIAFMYGPLREAILSMWRGRKSVIETSFQVEQLQVGLIVCILTGLFLSRAYVSIIYLLAGMAVAARRVYAAEHEEEPTPQRFSFLDLKRIAMVQGASLLYWRFMVRGFVNGL